MLSGRYALITGAILIASGRVPTTQRTTCPAGCLLIVVPLAWFPLNRKGSDPSNYEGSDPFLFVILIIVRRHPPGLVGHSLARCAEWHRVHNLKRAEKPISVQA